MPDPGPAQPAAHSSLEELIAQRRAKLAKLREAGVNPFPVSFDAADTARGVLERHRGLGPEAAASEDTSVAGRLMTRRDMGKAAFAHIEDRTGRLQVYLRKDEIGDGYDAFKNGADLGDIIGVAGTPFRTKTGEITLRAKSWRMLAKALRPPPEKFHGMTDVEERYRRREVDLFSNADVRRTFQVRAGLITALRRALDERHFLEVETPLMQPVPGGAAAKPFTTHHEALDMGLYLRIAPELYLKRLLVGGLERVYEIGRAFRNEGIDTRHNPEFTILEAYQAYTDVRGMMDLAESLIRAGAAAVGIQKSTYRGLEVDFQKPFSRLHLRNLFNTILHMDYAALCREGGWRDAAQKAGIRGDAALPDHKYFDRLLDERILPTVKEPSFILGYPKAFSPLAKSDPGAPEIAERFELYLAGEEVANAYSEQNDPDVQRERFMEQAKKRQSGDEEAMPADEEFLIALEHAMPPAGGLGIGIDRLTMVLTGTESIREVILFPLLRPNI
jgi:lysyl-tRNA synthetase, class II